MIMMDHLFLTGTAAYDRYWNGEETVQESIDIL